MKVAHCLLRSYHINIAMFHYLVRGTSVQLVEDLHHVGQVKPRPAIFCHLGEEHYHHQSHYTEQV